MPCNEIHDKTCVCTPETCQHTMNQAQNAYHDACGCHRAYALGGMRGGDRKGPTLVKRILNPLMPFFWGAESSCMIENTISVKWTTTMEPRIAIACQTTCPEVSFWASKDRSACRDLATATIMRRGEHRTSDPSIKGDGVQGKPTAWTWGCRTTVGFPSLSTPAEHVKSVPRKKTWIIS